MGNARKSSICKQHGGNTIIPTCAVDRVDTVQIGCRPKITSSDRAITVTANTDIDRYYYYRVEAKTKILVGTPGTGFSPGVMHFVPMELCSFRFATYAHVLYTKT